MHIRIHKVMEQCKFILMYDILISPIFIISELNLNTNRYSENEHNAPEELAAEEYPHRDISHSSTFSAGYVIGQFKSKQFNDDETSRQIEIWADADTIDQMDFALDTSWKILHFYLEYFDMEVPFKIDIVALPHYNHIDKWRYNLITIE